MYHIIFEDYGWKNFLPFTYTRFTGDMRAGVFKLRQRLGLYFDFEPTKVVIREELRPLYEKRHPDWEINHFHKGEYLFINSRLRVDTGNAGFQPELIQSLQSNQKLIFKNDIVAFKIIIENEIECSSETLYQLYESLETIEISTDTLHQNLLWKYTWEFLKENGNLINADFQNVFYEDDNLMEIDPGVVALNPYNIWIGAGSILQHGVILDASEGPIIIDENVVIMHNSVIMGPAFIGKNSLLKIGTRIYGNTSIGHHCKLAGEISGSIFQAYTNKQHDGFLGKSYVGEWVNIGADTNNSDLKNTYKPVKVWFYPEKDKTSTDDLFIGAFIGDHAKIGINCSINTGTVIGFGVNLYGSDLISDFIPSFSWGQANSLTLFEYDKFFETVSAVKKRRNEELLYEEIYLIKKIYETKHLFEEK